MNKNDTKRMNAVLRHRIRNSASGIKNAMTLLEKELKDTIPPEMLEYFPLIINECKSLSSITTRLNMIFEDVPSGSTTTVEGLLESLLSKTHSQFPTSYITINENKEACRIRLDNDQCIIAALHEVLINAIEASPKGVTISSSSDNNYAQFTIKDSGTAPDSFDDTFLLFYTSKTKHLGIGLNIAKRYIEHIGGEIALSRNKDAGITVDITLPLVKNRHQT